MSLALKLLRVVGTRFFERSAQEFIAFRRIHSRYRPAPSFPLLRQGPL